MPRVIHLRDGQVESDLKNGLMLNREMITERSQKKKESLTPGSGKANRAQDFEWASE